MKDTLFAILIISALIPVAAHSADECSALKPSEQGWWYVTPMPGYGVKGDVPQLLAGSLLTIWESPNAGITLSSTDESLSNKLTWRFNLSQPTGAIYRTLKVTFEKPLGGLKVDANANVEKGPSIRLLDEKSFFDNNVSVHWPDVKVTSVSITVHVHLQKRPILKEFAVGYMLPVKSVPNLDSAFQKEGVLYFFNPDGRTLKLCKNPKLSQEVPLALLKEKIPKEAKVVSESQKE